MLVFVPGLASLALECRWELAFEVPLHEVVVFVQMIDGEAMVWTWSLDQHLKVSIIFLGIMVADLLFVDMTGRRYKLDVAILVGLLVSPTPCLTCLVHILGSALPLPILKFSDHLLTRGMARCDVE